jgi:ketosteroid isomerase-like protein
MKKLIAAFALTLAAVLAFAPTTAYANGNVTQDLEDVVAALYEASTNADVEAIEDLISSSPHALFLGSDPDEVFIGRSDIVAWWEGLFAFFDSIGYPNDGGLPLSSNGTIAAGHKGNIGWIADDGLFSFANGDVPYRLTLVLRKEHGDWKIIQGHFSIGVPDETLPL